MTDEEELEKLFGLLERYVVAQERIATAAEKPALLATGPLTQSIVQNFDVMREALVSYLEYMRGRA